jgi:hypothetical protein
MSATEMLPQISKEKWDSLEEVEREVLRKLGVKVVDHAAPARPQAGAGAIVQRYIMLVESNCKLCKSVSVIPFSMEGVGTTLHSRQIRLDEITEESVVKTRREVTAVCPACRTILTSLSREDLIEVCLATAKGVR